MHRIVINGYTTEDSPPELHRVLKAIRDTPSTTLLKIVDFEPTSRRPCRIEVFARTDTDNANATLTTNLRPISGIIHAETPE